MADHTTRCLCVVLRVDAAGSVGAAAKCAAEGAHAHSLVDVHATRDGGCRRARQGRQQGRQASQGCTEKMHAAEIGKGCGNFNLLHYIGCFIG
jgi:hypothetical protein